MGSVSRNKMKREFLQGLQEENPLSKQTIDAIMAENGKDIQATRALFSDYESLKAELQTAKDTIASMENSASAALEEKVRQMEFSFMLRQAVTERGGRNQKAVEALLDLDTLQKAENPQKAALDALSQLQKENPWLFQSQTPPPYAPGTGTKTPEAREPATLAGALRERFAGGKPAI